MYGVYREDVGGVIRYRGYMKGCRGGVWMVYGCREGV